MIHYVGAAIFHVSASGQSVSKALMQSGYRNKKIKYIFLYCLHPTYMPTCFRRMSL